MTAMTRNLYNRTGPAAALLLLSLLAGQAAVAEPPETSYTMMALTDSFHGRLLVSGEYDRAMRHLSASKRGSRSFATQNNRCVALTKYHRVEQALAACTAAIELRSDADDPASRYASVTDRAKRRDKAIAHSNRGVLRAIAGDIDGAREDFEKALELEPGLDEPSENLALLTSRAATATG